MSKQTLYSSSKGFLLQRGNLHKEIKQILSPIEVDLEMRSISLNTLKKKYEQIINNPRPKPNPIGRPVIYPNYLLRRRQLRAWRKVKQEINSGVLHIFPLDIPE